MPRKGYSSVSIADELLEKIDEILKKKTTTYRTRSDFIKDAIRMRLRDLGLKGV